MTDEVYYHSKSKGEDMPVSEMSDLYVRRAFKKMILKEKKRFDENGEEIWDNKTNSNAWDTYQEALKVRERIENEKI